MYIRSTWYKPVDTTEYVIRTGEHDRTDFLSRPWHVLPLLWL